MEGSHGALPDRIGSAHKRLGPQINRDDAAAVVNVILP
jgi:hypothetical protein